MLSQIIISDFFFFGNITFSNSHMKTVLILSFLNNFLNFFCLSYFLISKNRLLLFVPNLDLEN